MLPWAPDLMLNRLRIRSRIMLGFGVSVAFALAVAAIGVLQFSAVRQHNRIADELAANMQRALEASHLLETIRRTETHYRLEGDDASLQERRRAETRVRMLLENAAAATRQSGQRDQMLGLLAALNAHDASFARLVDLTGTVTNANRALIARGRDVAIATVKLTEAARGAEDHAARETAGDIERLLLLTRVNNWRFQALYDPKGPAAFARDQERALAALAALAEASTGDVHDQAAALAAAARSYGESFERMAGATLGSLDIDQKELVPEIESMQARLAAVQSSLIAAYDRSGAKNARIIDRSSMLQQVLALLVLVAGGALAWLVGSGIARPIIAMTGAMIRLAGGDKQIAIPATERVDEIGDMGRAVEVFKQSMIKADRLTEELKQQIAWREEAEAKAAELARHDPLTGLPNRRLFAEEITPRLASVSDQDCLPMLLIDLDGFKAVNDVHGHHVGDTVLQEVVDRMREVLPADALIARLGGDEFAILMPLGHGQEELERVAYAIIKEASLPFTVQDITVGIGASIGIALAPADGTDSSSLLRAADIAMYRAKAKGGHAVCFFEAGMDIEMRAQAQLREELRLAVNRNEIVPYYQPLVDLRRGAIVGFEILARWTHPERGIVGPDKFIPLAEQMKLLTPMTLALLRQACLDARAWPENIRLAINIAPAQLQEPDLIDRITAVVREAGLHPERVELELVEDALIGDIGEAKRFIDAAHNAGMTVALDDFGTGHSSLSRLYELPLDKVKIDRSFMRSIGRDRRSAAYVAAIVNLGKTLQLCTTAEGIEDEEAMWTLEGMGCDFGQGYLYAKPVPAPEVSAVLHAVRAQFGQFAAEPPGAPRPTPPMEIALPPLRSSLAG
jgi:diguanylate cyclase (GGDEF)-like protein